MCYKKEKLNVNAIQHKNNTYDPTILPKIIIPVWFYDIIIHNQHCTQLAKVFCNIFSIAILQELITTIQQII